MPNYNGNSYTALASPRADRRIKQDHVWEMPVSYTNRFFFVAKFNNQLGFLMNYSFCSLTSKKPLVENVLSQHHDGVMSKTHTTVLQKERTAKDRRGMELPRQR